LAGFERNARGSWGVLREEYAPILIDSLQLSPATEGQYNAAVNLHTRGPIDVDMPVYTLRDYSFHWDLTSPDGSKLFSEGDVDLPTLAPASQWSSNMVFNIPGE